MKRLSRKLLIASASLLIALGSPAVALPAFAAPADAVVLEDTQKKDVPLAPTDEVTLEDHTTSEDKDKATLPEQKSPSEGTFSSDSSEKPALGGDLPPAGDTPGADDVEKAGEDGADGADARKDAGAEPAAEPTDDTKPTDGLGDGGGAVDVPPVNVTYNTHVQNIGWGENGSTAGENGTTAGTTGKGLRVEAFTVNVSGVEGLGVQYKAHVQNQGWLDWEKDGNPAGTTGESLRVEAIRLLLTGAQANQYNIWYRVHAQNVGWMGWARDGELAGTAGMSYRVEALQVRVLPAGSATPAADGQNEAMPFLGDLTVTAHVQNIGWQSAVPDPQAAGTTGRSLRVEAVRIALAGQDRTDGAISGGITYRAHVQNIGWQDWVSDGAVAGTTGQGLRVEALQAKLTGDMATKYDLYYRAHVSNIGWMPWAENGAYAGTQGMSARVEAIQLRLVPAGSAAPADDGSHQAHHAFLGAPTVAYAAYVQGAGWQADVSNGATAGVTGKGLRTEAIRVALVDTDATGATGGIAYRTHVQNVGWQDWVADGTVAGAPDQGLRMEALQISLTGDLARDYDVYYRAHVQNGGWLNWARNGATAGSVGQGLRVEAYEVVLRVKGQAAPGETLAPVYVNPTAGQAAVIDAAKSVPSPGNGLCAMWVSQVFERAGQPYALGNANDMYYSYCTSSDESVIKPGMVVAVAKHNHTYMGGIYGHIGVYVGNGQIMDNIGYIRTINFHEWTNWYGEVVPPKWGWFNGIALA